jgi:hypothetical protein
MVIIYLLEISHRSKPLLDVMEKRNQVCELGLKIKDTSIVFGWLGLWLHVAHCGDYFKSRTPADCREGRLWSTAVRLIKDGFNLVGIFWMFIFIKNNNTVVCLVKRSKTITVCAGLNVSIRFGF